MNNSYILEKRIAATAGMPDPKMIYEELFKRARIINAMAKAGITSYFQVFEMIKTFYLKGESALPLFG